MKLHTTLALTSFAVCAGLLATSASASVTVVGAGRAHDCFVAAKTGVNPEQGIALCNAALAQEALAVRDRAATLVNRGVMKIALGNTDAAMDDYNAGIALKSDLGDAYDDRGAALIIMKRYDEALNDISKGIELGMSYPDIGYFNRGVAEELTGQYKASYYDFKHALEINPEFTKASDQLKNFTVTVIKPGQSS